MRRRSTSDQTSTFVKYTVGKLGIPCLPTLTFLQLIVRLGVMIQAKLLPYLLYGTVSWLGMTKDQMNRMEAIFKKSIQKIISLPKSTSYEALLHEVSNIHIEQWIDALKLGFFCNLFHDKGEGRVYRTLRNEILDQRRLVLGLLK